MDDWSKYKDFVKTADPIIGEDIVCIEELSDIISEIIKQRHKLNLSQRDLADICGMAQSSIARIESRQTIPNVNTLIKLMKPLGLKLKVAK